MVSVSVTIVITRKSGEFRILQIICLYFIKLVKENRRDLNATVLGFGEKVSAKKGKGEGGGMHLRNAHAVEEGLIMMTPLFINKYIIFRVKVFQIRNSVLRLD